MKGSCSITTLEAALAGSLPADDEVSLQRHLEECEHCGAALERLAGGAAWRQEVAALLQTDELDEECPAREDFSAIDFTVDHLEPADEPNVLGRLGGYDVLEIIGSGGMGVVLKAFDRDLKRSVAIKVLAPHLAQSALARKRFAREAQAAAAVVHPHVLAIHQVQPAGRLPFLVTPLVAGESLAQRLAAQGALELKEVLRIGMQAAAGLAAAHEQGLVHRDVKPANILLEKGVERAVLTDFGLARAADDVGLTRGGVIAGTPQYMSPEQARGDALDGRSDLFSLGCVLYEMATGVSPFRTDSVMATIRRLVDEPPKPLASLNPELPTWFIGIVDRLLEKDPARRFGSAREVSDLLEGCLAHVQQPATTCLPESVARPAARHFWRLRRNRFAKFAMAIAASGIVLWGALMLTAEAPDIAGHWSGEDWGDVVLEKKDGGEYAGSFSDTVGKHSGELQLKWSRIERRYNGTWREGEDRFGELSVRLVGNEIRGALTTDPDSRINPATPRLADLKWTRAVNTTGNVARPGAPSGASVGFPRAPADAVQTPRNMALPGVSDKPHAPEDHTDNSEVRLFRLRFKLASDMADELRQILLGRPGHAAKPSADNQEILVTAPPDMMRRVQTYIAVTDWPDSILRRPNFEYPRETVARAARSFFYACAIEDSPEYFSNLLSVDVLAELKGDTKSEEYLEYEMGGPPDPDWEKSLRGDWPGKKEAIERMVREWNRHPLRSLREESGIAMGFGIKHFCSVSFEDADKSFYSVIIRPNPNKRRDGEEAYLFGSLPPWWKPGAEKRKRGNAQIGALSGQFVYDGDPPAPKDLFPNLSKLAADTQIEGDINGRIPGIDLNYQAFLRHEIRPQTTDASLLVGQDRGLANVVVWAESNDIPWTSPNDLKQLPATIRFQNGNYSPRMTVLVTGQPLIVENYDPLPINFHATFGRNGGITHLLLAGSDKNPAKAIFTLSAEEKLPTRYSSQKEIWGVGWLFVRKNPYVAVSQSDGSFTIPNLPVGKWEFRAWHERCGYVRHWPQGLFRQTIKAGDNKLGAIKVQPEQFKIAAQGNKRTDGSRQIAALEAAPKVDAWPTFRGDLGGTGVATTTLPDKPVVVWKRAFTKDDFEAAAAIVDGVVYVGGLDGKLYALSLDSGETKWEFHNSCGFKAAPAVRDGAVYIGDVEGTFHAIDAADGKERWQAASGAQINAGASFYGETVLFTSQDGGLYCLEPDGGKLVWKYAVDNAIQSSPTVVGDSGLLAACDGKLHVVDLNLGAAARTLDVEDPTMSTPAVAGDLAYWGTQGGRFMAVDWRQAQVAWTYDSPQHRPLLSSAALEGGLAVFGGKDGAVRALKLENGEEAWSFRTHDPVDSSPVVIGGRVFFGGGDGRFYALDLKTGEKTWEYEAGSRFVASPAAAEGRLVIGSEAGELYCFGP